MILQRTPVCNDILKQGRKGFPRESFAGLARLLPPSLSLQKARKCRNIPLQKKNMLGTLGYYAEKHYLCNRKTIKDTHS